MCMNIVKADIESLELFKFSTLYIIHLTICIYFKFQTTPLVVLPCLLSLRFFFRH